MIHQSLERVLETARAEGEDWGQVVIKITLWGLKKDPADGQTRMPEAYDRLVVLAREHGRPETEIEGFNRAKQQVLEMRAAREARTASKRG